MGLHINDIPKEAFEGDHKHFHGIIIPHDENDKKDPPITHHPNPSQLLRDKGLKSFLPKCPECGQPRNLEDKFCPDCLKKAD